MRLLGTFSFVKKLTIMFAMTAAYVAGEMVYNFLNGLFAYEYNTVHIGQTRCSDYLYK